MRKFQILIDSAVTLCEQYLQIASTYEVPPDPLPGLCPLTPLGTSVAQTSWTITLQWNFVALPLHALRCVWNISSQTNVCERDPHHNKEDRIIGILQQKFKGQGHKKHLILFISVYLYGMLSYIKVKIWFKKLCTTLALSPYHFKVKRSKVKLTTSHENRSENAL